MDCSHSPASDRQATLDDELAALKDSHRRRARARCDANAIIPKFTLPLAEMTQDALDDLRVVDQRHDPHLVLELGCHGTKQRIDFSDLLDKVPPLLRRDAPRLEREMLDDFHRRTGSRTTFLLRCCRRVVRGCLLCLLWTLPALSGHLVRVTAVKTHDLKALVWNVLRDRCDEIPRAEHLRE